MAQWSIDVALVAEPYFVPPSDCWLSDLDVQVAMVSCAARLPAAIPVHRGHGFVAARWQDILLVAVYFSPNRTPAQFEDYLGELGVVLATETQPALIAGDLNAHSVLFGSPSSSFEEWMAARGYVALNQGSVPTCVRPQGESIVDVTLAAPCVARTVRAWRVVQDVETLRPPSLHLLRASCALADCARQGSGAGLAA